MKDCTDELKNYIMAGVSPFHVVKESGRILKENGFQALDYSGDWNLEPGRGYYVSPYPSMLIAFRIGDEQVRIETAHTDQPVLRLKPRPTINRQGNLVANVESYGGMILHTWFDRPLALAGKVVCRSEDVFRPNVFLYDSGRPVAVVPSLAIHMDRDVNRKNELRVQENLLPLVGLDSRLQAGNDAGEISDPLIHMIGEDLDIEERDILDYDLFFYNPQEPETAGLNGDLLISPRLDNLTSCFSAVYAMTDSKPLHTDIIVMFDNEEIGSRTKQGADSDLFLQFLNRMLQSANQSLGQAVFTSDRLIDTGFIMSMDVAHGYHPNYPAKSDITTRTILGQGAVLKTSGQQKYNSDATSNAVIIQLAEKYGIPLQRQINNSDIAGGSTLGPIISSTVPVYGVDTGVPVLAMHSACETAAVDDCRSMADLARVFLEC